MMTEADVRILMQSLCAAHPLANEGGDARQAREARATVVTVSEKIASCYRPRQYDKALPAIDRDAAKLVVRLMEKDMTMYPAEQWQPTT